MATKVIQVPGRLHSSALDENGNRIPLAGTDEIFDDTRGKSQKVINNELYSIKDDAEDSAEEAKYYSDVTKDAINLLSPDNQEALTVAQKVVKHGKALEKIAEQLGSTYDDNEITPQSEYANGLKFTLIEEEAMEELIENPQGIPNGVVYLQLEPLEEEEE